MKLPLIPLLDNSGLPCIAHTPHNRKFCSIESVLMVAGFVNDGSGVSPLHAADHTICSPPMNPLVPTTYDVIMSLIFIASAILTISVIILIARSEASSTAKAMAGLAVIIFPIIGPVAYLVYRRASLKDH